ncbi:nitroreductase family protein [Acetobacter fallax]|uniref:Putative NAD(P)H nitroreductase n=1 Tax=Acetobacter fallax TaxID=1737473 RepID=A0ABX0K4Z8_9PROT|nr:nitroreductase [Acetobacter fallax]NHO31449.1 nitroreductase [Acetobacter fallax]NHO34967.1 nitroreductase [Acetobacter fallax]
MKKHEKIALDSLLSRSSTDDLTSPAPKGDELETILSAVMRAPDHGKLRPWRLVLVHGEARVTLAERVVASMKRIDPDVPEKKIEKRYNRFSTMPLIIVLGMHLKPEDKIPLIEQELAVGAAGMNLLNALHAAGYGAVWVSGEITYDPVFAAELGFPAPHGLAGFFFVGTPKDEDHHSKRRPVAPYVTEWTGEPVSFGADKD